MSARSLGEGVRFVWTHPAILTMMAADFGMNFFGSPQALLPIYARDILAVGPIGLGLLRSAPAVGALITSLVLARHPIERHIGHKMFAVVGIFGVTTILFGLSTSFPLSLLALIVLGASDAVSIVVRFSWCKLKLPMKSAGA